MKTVPVLFFALLLSASVWAQAPQRFNYQGVARNAAGEPLTDSKIGLKLSLTDGAVTLYAETFTPTTNALGLFTAEVGGGTALAGSFADIDWLSGPKYLKVEMDAKGGTAYVDMGTAQLLSVPYALVAEKAGNMSLSDLADVSDDVPQLGQTLQWNGIRWVPAAGGDAGSERDAVVTDATLSGDGSAGDPLRIAQQSAATGQVLKWTGSTWQPAVDGLALPYSGSLNSASYGIQVTNAGTGAALMGKSTSGNTDTYGIRGEANSNALSAGVHGRNVGPDDEGFGVFGTHEGYGIAVYGLSAGTGVMGQAAGTNCIGVRGFTYGIGSVGVLGEGSTGVRGESDAVNGKGVHGYASNGYAGYFEGKVFLNAPLMPNNSAGTSGQVLTSAGSGAAPVWASPSNQLFNSTYLWDQSAALSLTTSDQNVTFNGSTDLTFTTYGATKIIIHFSHGEVFNGSGGGGANSRVKFKVVLKDNAGSVINQANAFVVVPNNQLATVSYTHHCFLGASGTYKINIVAMVDAGDTDVSIAAAGGGFSRGQVSLTAIPQ